MHAARVARCLGAIALALILAGCSIESRFYYPGAREVVTPEGCTDAWVGVGDSGRLHAWVLPAPSVREGRAVKRPVVLFCHGSRATIDSFYPELAPLAEKADATLVLFSYRGYGRSSPIAHVTRRSTVQDARAMLDFVAAQPWADADNLFVMGYSLGGVPALAAASDRERAGFGPRLRGAIVGGTYSTARRALEDLEQGWAYPLIGGAFDPVDSLEHSPPMSLFIFHGGEDSTPGVYHAYLLAAEGLQRGHRVQVRIVPGASHYDVLDVCPGLLDEFAAFVREASKGGASEGARTSGSASIAGQSPPEPSR